MNFRKLLILPSILILVTTTPLFAAAGDTPAQDQEALNSHKQTSKIAYETRVEKDTVLPKGIEVVTQEGKTGTLTRFTNYENFPTSDGDNTLTKITYEEITQLPVEKVIRRGTNDEVIDGISEKTKKLEQVKSERETAIRNRNSRNNNKRTYSDKATGNFTSPKENRDYAKSVLSAKQFSCADTLVNRESGWKTNATNPSSGAYGVPQSLPASKLASAGADWRTNGKTQFKWMISYVKNRYGSFCGALDHSYSKGWY